MQGFSNQSRKFRIVLPFLHHRSDDELPSWFIKQSSTATINVKLDPNRRNNELIGFAMAFCSGANSLGNDFFCDIKVGCCKNWNTTHNVHTIYLGGIKDRCSNHLFIQFSGHRHFPKGFIQQLESPSYDTLEFSFYMTSIYGRRDVCSCGPCGVRLVYEEDRENLSEIISNYTNQHSSKR